MIMDIWALISLLVFCSLSMVAENNGIGGINENLEIIKPKMRKVKLPEKLKYCIPQWAKRGGADPPGAKSKAEVYILTLILTICNYIFHILCFIGTIIVYILIPSGLDWTILPLVCSVVVTAGITFVTGFQRNRIETKNRGRLDRDFTIGKHDKKK